MLEHEHSQGYVGLAFLAGVSYLLDFLSEIVLPVVLFLAALAAFGFLGALIRYYVVGHLGGLKEPTRGTNISARHGRTTVHGLQRLTTSRDGLEAGQQDP